MRHPVTMSDHKKITGLPMTKSNFKFFHVIFTKLTQTPKEPRTGFDKELRLGIELDFAFLNLANMVLYNLDLWTSSLYMEIYGKVQRNHVSSLYNENPSIPLSCGIFPNYIYFFFSLNIELVYEHSGWLGVS